jgi:copper chaperone CopZ
MRAKHLIAAICILTVFVGAVGAADKPAKPERFTYRVLGLFSPDREKDLRKAFEELPDFRLVAVDFEGAEVTIEFDPANAFPGAKPAEVVERFDQKLRQATRHTFGARPRRTVPKEKLVQVVIPVAGLDCKACCLAAYEIVARIDGVEQATAIFKDGKITARIDPARTDRAELEAALRKRGVAVGGKQ